jgi:uncharacterized protein (TIGR02996 family)
MSDDHAAFERAIADNPRDLLARLVYADFLEETGDPNHVARAHLIRAQIALDDPATDADDYDRLKALEGRLLDMFLDTWMVEVPYWLIEESGTVEYRRGFVEQVSLSFARFVRSADELFALFPLRSLHLKPPAMLNAEYLAVFELMPRLANIEELKLGPSLMFLTDFGVTDGARESPPIFAELMNCRSLNSLRVLDVGGNRVTDDWLIAFVSALPAAAFAGSLEVLNLSDCYHVTDAGANTLATARSLDRLKQLVMKDVPVTAAGRRMLRRRFGDRVSF